jgi:hypothetical protein
MVVGTLLHRKRYSGFEYLCMSLIGVGVGLFARRSSSKVQARSLALPHVASGGDARGGGGEQRRRCEGCASHQGCLSKDSWPQAVGGFRCACRRGAPHHPWHLPMACTGVPHFPSHAPLLPSNAQAPRLHHAPCFRTLYTHARRVAPNAPGDHKARRAERPPGLHPVFPEPLPGRLHQRSPGEPRGRDASAASYTLHHLWRDRHWRCRDAKRSLRPAPALAAATATRRSRTRLWLDRCNI